MFSNYLRVLSSRVFEMQTCACLGALRTIYAYLMGRLPSLLDTPCFILTTLRSDIDIVVCSPKFPDEKIPLFQLTPVMKQIGFAEDIQINRFAKIPVMIIRTTEEFGKFFTFILIFVAVMT
jgi:hypothetical protein